MELKAGSQLLLSGRAGVVVSVTEFAGGAVITIFWPATCAPPEDRGLRGLGSWRKKLVTLLKPIDGHYMWDVGLPARLSLNTDPTTHIQLGAWMQAFVERCSTS